MICVRAAKSLWQWRRPSCSRAGKDQENDEYRTPSIKDEGKDQILPNTKGAKAKQRASQEPYAEACSLDDTEDIQFFNKWSYRVTKTIALNTFYMPSVNGAFDTWVRPYLQHEDTLEADSISRIRLSQDTQLQSWRNWNVKALGKIMPQVHMKEICIRIVFRIINVSVDHFQIVKSFIPIIVKETLPADWMKFRYCWQPVPILIDRRQSITSKRRTNDVGVDILLTVERNEEYVVCVKRVTPLHSITETPFVVATNTSKIVQIDSYSPFGKQYQYTTALKIIYIFSKRRFHVSISNGYSFLINPTKQQQV